MNPFKRLAAGTVILSLFSLVALVDMKPDKSDSGLTWFMFLGAIVVMADFFFEGLKNLNGD